MSMIFYTFRAQLEAKRGVNALKNALIPSRLGKTPAFLAVDGCGYGIWVPESYGAQAARKLRNAGIRFEKSFRVEGNRGQEVEL